MANASADLVRERRNLTYVMLFRVTVVTLLLFALLVSEWVNPEASGSALLTTLSRYILLVYALTIASALTLRRTENLMALATAHAAVDLLLTGGLVYLTGGADSSFVFLLLLSIVGAAVVLRRFAILLAFGGLLLYAIASVLVWMQLVPQFAMVPPVSLAALIRTVATNSIAFVATGLLAGRLGLELGSARATVASQETQIRDLEKLHREIVSSLTSGLLTISSTGTLLTFNQAASDILGIKLQSMVGRPIVEILQPLGALVDRMRESSLSLRRVEVRHGERILGVSVSPLIGEGGGLHGRIINFQDVTELRKMEEIVARSTQLAAIGRLAAGIAHEIRNPLQAISGSIELIAALPDLTKDESARELMQIVLIESERLNALISELLDFARPREPQLSPIDLGLAVREVVAVSQHDRSLGNAKVELRLPPSIWVHADAAQLRQVLWNLLRNAAEADPTGPIEVSLVTEAADNGETGTNAVLRLRDHGPGIAPELRSRIFEPFFSTKEKGTGLGLAIVHRIIEQHRGTITADAPTDGTGTTMTIRLPRQPSTN